MISVDEVEKTILDLEQRDTSYAVCEKLSWLYIVRDHLRAAPVQTAQTYTVTDSDSEFVAAAKSCDFCKTLSVLDEHMQCIKAIYPKEYDALMKRLLP